MATIKDMLNLAKRGRFLSFGEPLFEDIKRKRVSLVILSSDINERVYKELEALKQIVPFETFTLCSKEELGSMIDVLPLNAIGIKNSGIAKKIRSIRKENLYGSKKEEE